MHLKVKRNLSCPGTRIFSCFFLMFGLFISLVQPAAADKNFQVAMITWRGETDAERGFMEGMQNSGYHITFRKYDANQNLKQLTRVITEIETIPFDLIYVFGTTATRCVLSRIKNRPVVFNIVSQPVETGIIKSWESSGNNATGASSMVPILNQLKALKKVVDYSRLGIIYNPLEPNSMIQRNIVKNLEGVLGFILTDYRISGKSDIPRIIPGLEGRVDAVFLPADSMIKSLGREIMKQVNEFNIPSLTAIESMVVSDNALMGLVPSYYRLGRLSATKAILILQSVKPSDIPSETLDYFHISVNMNTAKKIGVYIPISILIIADKIVR